MSNPEDQQQSHQQVQQVQQLWAIDAGVSSYVAVGQRAVTSLKNIANATAEGMGLNLSYQVIMADPDQANDVIAETIDEEGNIVSVDFTGGYTRMDNVLVNTAIPVFLTFKKPGTYIFTLQLYHTDTKTVLAEDIEIAVAVRL
ncbi:hypothetical protein Desor_4957 [Desulfosporosinus orientis DSM 765]|uniref:Uncharacterized protein n=1 Tax=Desulfosporosinus orientis (strain ATCC 19365 / DSM 765 / NCIMB 8382 / VKM B-1628 / Singapore I) TaxID=768706 RepID=G7WJ42_DESOD|nr:hypothetical protein [Desulfosporosinus orientis]AET70354.1 hypothetical protein Desor_4957 [Desulfosporosinus orientis DSM 765]